tara:strand:- start:105 stop:3533 length:3429 start_codon:yes stop_codon:yes gene_type:complete
MKRIFFISTIGVCILSWIFFLSLFLLTLFPTSVFKAIDQYALPSYSIDFSELQNTGNPLNQNFKFFDINIMSKDRSILNIKELVLGVSFKPHVFFQPISINSITIKDGYFLKSDVSTSSSFQNLFVGLKDEVLLSFKNFKYQRNNSIIEINGDLFGKLSSSFSGQFSFLHDNNLSTLAVDVVEDSYRLSLNLHSYQWFSLIPAFSASPFKDLTFQINALGELQNDQSIIKGSFNSNSLFLNSLSINPNKGSFHFQSKKNIGTLTLTNFLNPFVDEENPIQINLQKKSVSVPRFFLSPQILEIDKLKFTNLIIENFFISFGSIFPKYSGFIKDIDLKDLYFEEILNLSGDFSGYGENIKFLVNSEASILKNHKKNFTPVSIMGVGDLSGSALDFIARVKNQSASIDLALQISPKSIDPFSIELKGKDISKDLIAFLLPDSLNTLGAYIDTSIIPGRQNSIYYNYSGFSNSLTAEFKAKILINESKLVFNEDLVIDFSKPLIEADNENLYVFSPAGKVTNFSYESAYGLLNYKSQKLSFYSQHSIKSIDLKDSLGLGEGNFNLPSVQAEHRGEIKLSSLSLNNAISVKTKNFYLPTVQPHEINLNKGSIYIVDLDSIYGLLPSTFMKEKLSILLMGTGLTKKYDLTFSTNINLEPGNFIPDSYYFQVSGNDSFKVNLNLKKNSMPVLKVNSDLKNIEFNSPLTSVSKKKLSRLPTEILITNFSNPSLKLSNKKIDMHIKDFSKYVGYISIGEKLPEKYMSFGNEPGLNLYLYSEVLTENLFSSALPRNSELASINLNKFAFNIKNFKFYNNNFSDLSGLFDLNNSEIVGNLMADNLNLNFRMDQTGFMRIEINDSIIPDIEFINSSQATSNTVLNSRLIIRNSSLGKIKIKAFEAYLLNNKKYFTANKIKLDSNLISIKPFKKSSIAYFSIDKVEPLYKIRGDFLIKDSNKIPYLRHFADFSYFNGSINLQLKELSTLSHIEGESNFILKDLAIKDPISDSMAFNLLGVLNLRNILGKLANLDLSIDEYTSTQLGRVEGDLLFSKSKLRLASPLFIETNAAKMKWVGQINKNSKNNLDDLDLNLDLRITIGENLPWYAAILGGLPAVAGSAVINEIFEEDINDLTNYKYEITGTISEPKLERVK